ncbi:MAG: methionyl-tRNA formyltransferase [Clostridiales bacterium]|nr:methionyl-tRNA formyltransferase [Clostridiales bacterium]
MKIIYAGSPEYAVAPLKALKDRGHEIVAVLTQPDKPVGRKRVLTPTPVKRFALSLGLPVLDFVKVKEHADELKSFGADIMITCAYGQLLTDAVLKIFPSGVYNLHASLLPKFRGASPVQSAILAGEEYTGVTVMRTELALDCGAVLLVKRCKIGGATCGELSEKLSELSAEAAVEAVGILERGEPQLLLQDEAQATYCKKITKADAAVDFSKPAAKVARLINAFSPSPAAYAFLNGGAVNLLKAAACDGEGISGTVLSADKRGIVVACGEGAVSISLLQFAGGKAIGAADAVNGRKIKAGDKFD